MLLCSTTADTLTASDFNRSSKINSIHIKSAPPVKGWDMDIINQEIRKLTPILDALQDGICIISRDYIVEFMNEAMVKMFGQGTGEDCYRTINHLDGICPWCRAMEIIEEGRTLHRDKLFAKADKVYSLTELPLKNADGTVSKLTIYRDITQEKKHEEKLRASEQDYRRLFEHVACGVFISSKEGKFLDANQALLDMLGYPSKEEFLQIDIANDLYLIPDERKKFTELIEQNGHVIDHEVFFKRKDGKPIPVLLTGHVRYDENGNILGYEGLNVDQSRRKQMEKELEKTRVQLLQAEKMASLGKLAAGVAHQLNNPLGGIKLFTQLIMEEYDLSEKAREDLDRILADVQRCSDIVKQLLEFSRQTNREIQAHDINRAVSRTLFLLENQTLFQNIEVEKNLAPDIPQVPVDIQQMNQVFMNIILNAAEAMEGNGKLTLKTYRSAGSDRVCIEISDTGPGIAEEVLPHIFEPFFTTKEQGKGTGLGLSLVYGIVENHRGRISARNNPGQGVTFLIELLPAEQENRGAENGKSI
jgi:PAS domain S-box-containing protein